MGMLSNDLLNDYLFKSVGVINTKKTMGKTVAAYQTAMKCRAVPYVKSTVKKSTPKVAQVAEETNEEYDILRLIGELQTILPTTSSANDSTSTIDIVEKAISYICKLEEEAGEEDLKNLHQQINLNGYKTESL